MSDFKSKLPDLKELGEITGKLFKDIKTSVEEIVANYKKNHPSTPTVEAKPSSVKEPRKNTPKSAEKSQEETKE